MEQTELLLAGLDAMQRATTVPTAGIVTFKDGLIAGWHDYGDRAAARDAAGL